MYNFLFILILFKSFIVSEIFSQKSAVRKISNEFKHISDYTTCYMPIESDPHYLAIRQFSDSINKKKYYLALNINTLETRFVRTDTINKFKNLEKKIINNYERLRNNLLKKNNNYTGINNINRQGYVLTLDLCPSTKKFDKLFYDFIVSSNITPIYINISGKWIQNHKDDLAYIISNKKNCTIYWVNHSLNHYYDPKKANKNNFMLDTRNVFENEVLNNEIVMIKNGLIPSPFFRFPGLIANDILFKKILDYGLIPIGSDAWLAKGQNVKSGSILLLHINGNEPTGLKLFKQFFKSTTLVATQIY